MYCGETPSGAQPKTRTSSRTVTTHPGPSVEEFDGAPCLGCHDDWSESAYRHPLTESAECSQCHARAQQSGPCPSGGFELVEEDSALCERCHEVPGVAKRHSVIRTLGCSACHDPHGSNNPRQLKRPPEAPLCQHCHEDIQGAFVHTPVKDGNCLGCHDPHRGDAAMLLEKPLTRLCVECHQPATLMKAGRVLHTPVLEGRCIECHDAHASDFPKQTRGPAKSCLRCHGADAPRRLDGTSPSSLQLDLKRRVVHKPVAELKCDACHEAQHSSEAKRFLKKDSPELCDDCHERPSKTRYVHGAVKLGSCSACHAPHSTDAKKLLRDGRMGDLCFRCHADDVTGRVSVHRPVGEGNCGACHAPHGADNPFNLKQPETPLSCFDPCHDIVTRERPCNPLAERCMQPERAPAVQHEALTRWGCVGCHDPHGSSNGALMIKAVNFLCQECHAEQRDGRHVSTFVLGGHVVSGGPDTHDRRREFSCVSCHNPHGSENPKLLYFGRSALESCDWCHGNRSGTHPELKDLVREGPEGQRGQP